jgi:hypothetical protein
MTYAASNIKIRVVVLSTMVDTVFIIVEVGQKD